MSFIFEAYHFMEFLNWAAPEQLHSLSSPVYLNTWSLPARLEFPVRIYSLIKHTKLQ